MKEGKALSIYKNILIGLPLLVLSVLFISPGKAHAAWNPSNIISDAQFSNSGAMSEQQVQEFLVNKNSYLANYSETRDSYIGPNNDINSKGWSASKIIWQSANWYGLNPQVILATLQKEQSLVTTGYLNQYGIDWAMGYGVPDGSGRDYSKQGFSMQVDWGTWQLAWNMQKANSSDPTQRAKVAPYYTGNTLNICYTYGSSDCANTYISNGATASLYRYTPYFHGNMNFANIMSLWFNPYDYEFVSAINPPEVIAANQTKTAQIVLKNTGSQPWYNDSQNPLQTPMRLYVYRGAELYSADGSWESTGRIRMTTSVVQPGQNGVFNFTVKMPNGPGSYQLAFFPIIENTTMLKDVGMKFDITVPPWQGMSFVSAVNPPDPVSPNSTVNVSIALKNLSSTLWQNDANNPNNPTRLAVLAGSDLYEATTWASSDRIKMTTATAGYGETAYFNFKMKFDSRSSIKTLKITPVIEGVYQYQDSGMSFTTTSFDSTRVHRFWSASRNAHFYTNDLNEFKYASVNPSIWTYEGTSYQVYRTTGNALVPVYRFWSQSRQVHFYTISEQEKQAIVANMPEWKLEGIVYYVYQIQTFWDKPVYRFWSDKYKVHFYTISEDEKNYVASSLTSIWRYEGVSWYAVP
jgi:hypothetical protein